MLLRQAGVEPLIMPPEVDEEAVIAAVENAEGRVLPPDEHVLLLARRKAADVAARLTLQDPSFDGLVIGGDSMFELDGAVLGKPHTAENAIARWAAMRGRTGVLHSGHSVYRILPGVEAREAHAVAEASVTFADDVTDAEVHAYVATGEPRLHRRQPGRPVHRAGRGRSLDRGGDVAVDHAAPRPRTRRGVDLAVDILVGARRRFSPVLVESRQIEPRVRR
jgi:predicted house-cleaning NTP pyrophosphatase (Maf/HAM1 superfamily)